MSGVLVRLGQTLYWAGCGVGCLCAAFGAALSFAVRDSADRWLLLGCGAFAAFIAWLTGRACRYVLAGR